MSPIRVGALCTFNYGNVLFRNTASAAGLNRRWQRLIERDPEGRYTYGIDPDKGWPMYLGYIIGQRTLSNGHYDPPSGLDWDYEPGQYQIKETFRVYLVVRTLYEAPLRLWVEDVEILGKG